MNGIRTVLFTTSQSQMLPESHRAENFTRTFFIDSNDDNYYNFVYSNTGEDLGFFERGGFARVVGVPGS